MARDEEQQESGRANPPPFDPHKYTVKTKGGKEYLQVAERVRWMNADREAGGYEITIHSQVVFVDADRAVVMSTVTIPGRGTATGVKSEVRPGLGGQKGFGNYVEKAHTQSIGRALALLGYGTEMALELWEEDAQAGGEASEAADTPRTVETKPAPPAAKKVVTKTDAGGITMALKASATLEDAQERREKANAEIKRLAREHGYVPPSNYAALVKMATEQYGYLKFPAKIAGPQALDARLLEEFVVHMKHVAGDPTAATEEKPTPFEQAPQDGDPPEKTEQYERAVSDLRRALGAYTIAEQLDDVIELVRTLHQKGCLHQADLADLEAAYESQSAAIGAKSKSA